MKSIAVIIQARMGSSRLPGKVIMDISGKPMLWHVIDRVKKSKKIDYIIVATTTQTRRTSYFRIIREYGC